MNPKVGIIDYGYGNQFSILSVLKRLGADFFFIEKKSDFNNCDRILFPGQGHFSSCMSTLYKREIATALDQEIQKGTPFMGICLGYQILFNRSEEGEMAAGLGIFEGEVINFNNPPYDQPIYEDLKTPHMGWNQVFFSDSEHPMLHQIKNGEFFYFVHSYYPISNNTEKYDFTCKTDYYYNFLSGLCKDNIFSCQFHPEKSQKAGVQLMKNFLNWRPR